MLASLSLSRRISYLTYVAWLFAEGVVAAFAQISAFPIKSTFGVVGLETYITLCVDSLLIFALLHSYVAGDFANYGVRLTIFLHQLGLLALSVWRLSIESTDDVRLMAGFRVTLFCCCVIVELSPISVEIGDLLTKIEEDIYTDNELALHAILREYRRMDDSEKDNANF